MIPVATRRATFDDLMATEGKAELIGGEVVHLMSSGNLNTEVASNIYLSLRSHAKATRSGLAKADGVGFRISQLPSGRESFAPDAAFIRGNPPMTEDFITGAPTFAVEVRSKNDHGKTADREYAEKRDDYFAAGTLVVWDVDPRVKTIGCFHQSDPLTPIIFKIGQIADAEPAVPGWRIAVEEVFEV